MKVDIPLTAATTAWTLYAFAQTSKHMDPPTMTGLLVHALHKTKFVKKQKLALLPYAGEQTGLTLLYKL